MRHSAYGFLCFIAPVLSFWRQASDPSVSNHASRLSNDLGKQTTLNKLERGANHYAQAYRDRSDCFTDASQSLHSSCESLDFDSSSRVKAAVHMALCEIITAEKASLPLECKSIRDISLPQAVSKCVEALGRSAQHWASYSGYLRDIPQLCTAYRRLHEIDHAKSIYANITRDKIGLLASMDIHRSNMALHEQELESLVKILRSSIKSLEFHTFTYEASIAELPSRADELMGQFQLQVGTLLDMIAASTLLMNKNLILKVENQLNRTIAEAQNVFSSSAQGLASNIDDLAGSLNSVALSWNSRLVGFNRRLDTMWKETYVRKLALEKSLEDLTSRVSRVGAQVDMQLASAERLQELSSETSVSIHSANERIFQTSSALSEELGILVHVTRELQGNITQIPNIILNPGWLPNLLRPVSSIINGIQLPTWQAQLVMHIVGVGASNIQSSLSLLLTIGSTILLLVSQMFHHIRYLLNTVMGRPYLGANLSRVTVVARPQGTARWHMQRRAQASQSRLSSVLPHYENGSL